MVTSDERMRILKMIQEGKIPQTRVPLPAALRGPDRPRPPVPAPAAAAVARRTDMATGRTG
jgi:hypothetical protein